MAHRVFFLNTLREGVDPSDYERFVREVDYPWTETIASIDKYVVTRLEGVYFGERSLPGQYLEVVEVNDMESYRRDLDPEQSESTKKFFDQWSQYVADTVAVYGEEIL